MFALVLLSGSAGCFAANGGSTAAAREAAAGFTLDQLMKSLALRRQGEVTFVEEDDLGILDRAVKSSGVLVYSAPDHLEKRTLQPKKESLMVDGDQLTVQRGRRTYRARVSAYPQVASLVDAMRDTLAGNEAGLQKVFKVGLTGVLEGWQLELVPLDKSVARKVKRVEISGARDEIRSFEILQTDGDRSVMTLGAPGHASEGHQ